MRFFEITQHNSDAITGIRIGFLWLFYVTITHNHNKGNHLSVGFGISKAEMALQLSLWSL